MKKCRIIALETNNNNNAIKLGINNNYYHLYMISNDKIKEDDYYYSIQKNEVETPTGIYKADKSYKLANEDYNDYKVIMTTDKSLNLPEIPESFVEKYIKRYNDNDTVEYVLVLEYNNKKLII